MRKRRFLIVPIILLNALLLYIVPAAAQMPQNHVQMQRFNDAFPVIIDNWKVHEGDVPNAQDPDFDDSAWTPAQLGYNWQGISAVAWFRKSMALPPEAQGKRVYIEVMANDGGEVFADGRCLGTFQNSGRFLLTESADTSSPCLLAVKGINNGGNAAFTFAGYQISAGSAAEDVRAELDALRALGSLNTMPATGWKFSDRNSKKYPGPNYDDSKWEAVTLSHRSGSAMPTAWYRARITVPESFNGFPVQGLEIKLKLRARIQGMAFVNGRPADKFERDSEIILTPSAAPGEQIVVAVRVQEMTGDLRLEEATLHVPALDGAQEKLDGLAADLDGIASLFEQHPSPDPAWISIIGGVLRGVSDLVAMKDKTPASFDEKISAIYQEMKPVAQLIDRFPVFVKGPYLQNVTRDSMVVMWQTAVPASACVMYGKTKDYDQVICRAGLQFMHEIRLPGLEPETTYHYAAVSGELASPDFTLRTAPHRDTPFLFSVWGDSRTDYRTHQSVIKAMLDRPRKPDIALNVGDVVTTGDQYDQWGREHFLPIRSLGFTVPTYIAIGNHEYGGFGYGNPVKWFEIFVNQPGNEYYFAFTYGNSRFIVVNPQDQPGAYNIAPGTEQYEWLIREFESEEYKSATFHFIFLHEPPYSEGWSGGYYDGESALRTNLVPLVEKYGIDILFAGHTHDYERGMQNGAYYIIAGGGGASLDDTIYHDWPHIELVKFIYHFVEVDINGNKLEFRAIDRAGNIFDEFTIEK